MLVSIVRPPSAPAINDAHAPRPLPRALDSDIFVLDHLPFRVLRRHAVPYTQGIVELEA